MKKIIISLLVIFTLSCQTYKKQEKLTKTISLPGLNDLTYNIGYTPDKKELQITHYILSHINEYFIHQMNVSYSYYTNDKPAQKFLYDTLPWLANSKNSKTSFRKRLYYYTLDLDTAIQRFIFEGRYKNLKSINFNKLSDSEKEVYYIFIHILFNNDYELKLIKSNFNKFQSDGDYYYKYYAQIHKLLGYTPEIINNYGIIFYEI